MYIDKIRILKTNMALDEGDIVDVLNIDESGFLYFLDYENRYCYFKPEDRGIYWDWVDEDEE